MYGKYNSIEISIIDIDYDMKVCALGVILPIIYILIIQTESGSFQSCQSSSQVYDYLILCKPVQSWLLSGELMQEQVY